MFNKFLTIIPKSSIQNSKHKKSREIFKNSLKELNINIQIKPLISAALLTGGLKTKFANFIIFLCKIFGVNYEDAIFHPILLSRISSERNVSRKNAKIFGHIWQTCSQKLMKRNFAIRNFAKCENFVKIMSFVVATINCSEELVEFYAVIAQYLKVYYVI